MTSRLETWVAAVQAQYAGAPDTTWFFGAEHIDRHDNWNRIVVWPTTGPVRNSVIVSKGRTTEIGGRDDVVFERVVNVSIGIWAESFEQAEHRLHGVLLAIEYVQGQADTDLTNITEQWVRAETKDVTSGGSMVVLSFDIPFNVYTADADIVDAYATGALPAPDVGEGVPTAQVTNVDITVIDETPEGDETTVTVNIDETEEP